MLDFNILRGPDFEPTHVTESVIRFYEQTAAYDLDIWSQWAGIFRPFGWLLAAIFSRRLQQLNVPLSGLDTSRGVINDVLQFIDPTTSLPKYTAWYRRLCSTGNVLYAGFYSACKLPNFSTPCVKVVFPLPNGNAIVIMRPESRRDGSFMVTSAGQQFGDPGFYFTVHGRKGVVWVRYVKSLRETIHVFPAENENLRLKYRAILVSRYPSRECIIYCVSLVHA
jgi:hypothetical protein